MNSSFEFSFDHWVSLNRLDPQLCRILIDQKIDSVAAILGLQDQDCQELFQGLPTGLRTSFRYARNSLITTISSERSSTLNRMSVVTTTPPDPETSKSRSGATLPIAATTPKPERPPRKSPTSAFSAGTIPFPSQERVLTEKASSLPKNGGTVKKIAQNLDKFYKQQAVNPIDDTNSQKSMKLLDVTQRKVSLSSSLNELPKPRPTPPPIPKRPDHKLLVKISNVQDTATSITNKRSTTSCLNITSGEADCSESFVDDSIADSDYFVNNDVDEEDEYFYDVPPMPSPEKIKENTMVFTTGLEEVFRKPTSRLSDDMTLYQHYEDQDVTIRRNRTFESMDRRSELTSKKVTPPLQSRKRTIWSELPQVIEKKSLDSLSEAQINCKEALFEIITSQGYFVRSMTIATTFFVQCPMLSGQPHLGSCINMQERKTLFSNLADIKDANDELLQELETHLEQNYLLPNVTFIIANHIRKHSKLYIQYCSNQIYQERMLSHLKSSNVQFQNVMTILEGSNHCENLDLRSFLLSPMQRVTRYPLLLNAVLRRTVEGSEEFLTAEKALSLSNKMANDCNETARKFERIEQLVDLDKKFAYESTSPKRIPLTNSDRWLLKQNLACEIHSSNGRIQNRPLSVYLFTDMLVITKPQKNGKQFLVIDYCLRPFVEMISVDLTDRTNWPSGYQLTDDDQMISCTFLKNVEQKRKTYFLKFETETDKVRWLEGYKPPSDDQTDKIYDRNDCPQAEVVTEYRPNQEDELDLKIGDILNVLKKMSDGWYQGERLRDHTIGWFPSFYVKQINNYHEQAKTIRIQQKLAKDT